MKQQNRLILLSALLSTIGLSGCGNDSNSCEITEESCQVVNKVLDADSCECVDVNPAQDCQITQADCDKESKTLDQTTCKCISSSQCSFNNNAMTVGQKVCDAAGNVITCQENGTTRSTACERGICVDGDCQSRRCEDIADGQKICKDLKLMTCDDGKLVEAADGCSESMLCRDGDHECSNYKLCENIPHDANGCLAGNIVKCNDGEITLVEDCLIKDQFCAANSQAEGGFECKLPDPTDCEWNGSLVKKGQTVCENNVLKTCSAEIDTKFDEGTPCVDIDPTKPICEPDSCREEKYCGPHSDITPGAIVCNNAGTNKAKCVDGQLVDLTDDACTARENATSVCTFNTEAICSDTCNRHYVDIGGKCQPETNCDAAKEIYDSTTNTCACNTNGHWVGNAGACQCETNYVDINGTCELKKTCDAAKEIYDATTNTCDCNTNGHWAGNAGACQCETNYVDINDTCELKKTCDTAKEIYNATTNTCDCNTNGHWVKKGENCSCDTGYFQKNETCELLPSVGDIITFGHYEQDNNATNGKESITWIILEIKNDQLLLISEKALDVQPYHTEYNAITWARSTIRSWLNGYDKSYNAMNISYTNDNFIDAAFTSAEKAKIVKSSAPNQANPNYPKFSQGVSTTDYIILLSIEEAQSYFTNPEHLKADATRYAMSKNAYVYGSHSQKYTSDGSCTDEHCISRWWLRTLGNATSAASLVSNNGSLYYEGNYVNNTSTAVRPVLRVKVQSVL